MPVQPRGQFLFQVGELFGEFLCAAEQFAHLHERPTTNTLMRTAAGLFKTLAAITAPFSVKA